MKNAFFLHQIKHTSGNWDKGIVVKDNTADNLAAVKQSYHAYLGAYAYGHDAATDFVQCMITDIDGSVFMSETWSAPEESAEPEA